MFGLPRKAAERVIDSNQRRRHGSETGESVRRGVAWWSAPPMKADQHSTGADMGTPGDNYGRPYDQGPPTEGFPPPTGAYPASAYPPPPPPHRGGPPAALVVLLTLLVVVILALVGAGVWLLVSNRSSGPGQTAASTSTATVTASAPAANTPDTVQAPAPVPAPAPVAGPPAGSSACGSTYGNLNGYTRSAVGSSVTSCPFAEEVRYAYAASGPRGSNRVVTAVSPVNGAAYDMNCVANYAVVTCAGGNNAIVYIY